MIFVVLVVVVVVIIENTTLAKFTQTNGQHGGQAFLNVGNVSLDRIRGGRGRAAAEPGPFRPAGENGRGDRCDRTTGRDRTQTRSAERGGRVGGDGGTQTTRGLAKGGGGGAKNQAAALAG